jgi:uncharacterized protein
MTINVIIVHGAYGHPQENWFGWLHRALHKQHIPCLVPSLPTPQGQTLENWLYEFDLQTASHINSQTILIGHSLGAVFILRWLERCQQRLAGAIFAGAFLSPVGIERFDLINQSFLIDDYDFDKIRSHADKRICYHGKNDPYVNEYEFKLLARYLQAKRILISNGGHLNAMAGYQTFPHILHLLNSWS